MSAPAATWYQVFAPRPAARAHLYCLPCAGGGASSYRPWATLAPDWLEIRAVLLRGRQSRYGEPALTDADEAAALLADALPAGSGATPYALFGHSMGALLSYRMTRLLLERGARLPTLLATAAWPVFGIVDEQLPDWTDDEAILRAVRHLGGSAAAVLDDPEMRAIALPVLRADFSLCASYTYRPAPPLPVPVAVYGGVDDPVTGVAELSCWRDETVRMIGPRLFPGGHFFLQDDPAPTVAAVVADLADVLSASPATGGAS